ncbi:hypothetical protein HanOQP8_Chr07g0257211 [Helianthus annuus]|nr:hypothetical protein HanHA89_Chr07g0267461 [Helianthus annuus]KAJ0729163.1 hypothetical protein HanLR1_Chr07g0249871 [Helianthus annuus]KAJ0731902.1 hypothetical protein HanOQP8_Chr07g0257211 [Helianthus annuus]
MFKYEKLSVKFAKCRYEKRRIKRQEVTRCKRSRWQAWNEHTITSASVMILD